MVKIAIVVKHDGDEYLPILKQGVHVWNKWREENPRATLINFSGVNLGGLDLRGANLTGINFNEANLSKTDLRNTELGLSTFYRTDFTNSNLCKVNFQNSNAAYANLSLANLSYANLSLARTSKADFSHAIFTGSCLQDFYLDRETKFDCVECDYFYKEEVYLNQQRKYLFKNRCPHNPEKKFTQGEFTKLFHKTIETVDLVFSDGINWQAFLHSFQKLQIECNSEELAIQTIEKKSGGAFVIRVEVPQDADKGKIETCIKNEYKIKLKSLEENYKLQLNAKDEQINIYRQHNTDLLEIIKLKASQPVTLNNSMSNINQYHSGNGDNVGRDKNINNIHDSPELTQTIKDIQALLEKLGRTYNPNTTTGKMTIATKAIDI